MPRKKEKREREEEEREREEEEKRERKEFIFWIQRVEEFSVIFPGNNYYYYMT